FCGAQEAHFFLLDEERSTWVRKATVHLDGRRRSKTSVELPPVRVLASRRKQLGRSRSVRTSGRSAAVLLDGSWQERFGSAWSVPLVSDNHVAGVMQFAFSKRYDWLPREQELLQAAAERCLLAAEKASLIENLAISEEQIRLLAEHMLHIEEVERRRISSELHDEAGQSMLYVRLQLEMLEKEIPDEFSEWKRGLTNIREITERAILETRRLIAALSPAVLEQLGLAAALRQLVSRFRQHYECRVKLQVSRLDELPKRMDTIVYRLVQECFNNIGKHSQASAVNISVSSADGILRLHVEDDGVGFDVAEVLARRNSFGLAGMRERVTLLGGSFEIRSTARSSRPAKGGRRPYSGTKIAAELPIPEVIELQHNIGDRAPRVVPAKIG
ncbi:MAG: GAF domain-containing sensor histidine kinase, partial [bacterium]|nr:GAF domain-containing sensor histidine kinase [bacterium]